MCPHTSSRKSFLSVVMSREQGRLYIVVQEPTEDPPILLESWLQVLGGAARQEKGGLQLLRIWEWFST